MSDLQEWKSEITLNMRETVPQDETGDTHHSESESSVPFQRKDLEQSRDVLEDDIDPSQKYADLTQRRKESVTPTSFFPTADEIEIPDLVRWVAKNSAFEAGTSPSKQEEDELLLFES